MEPTILAVATKLCPKCGTEKPLLDFYFRKDSQKHHEQCKICIRKKQMARSKKEGFRERERLWRQKREKDYPLWRQKRKEQSRLWCLNNAERCAKNAREWERLNKERSHATRLVWRKRPGTAQKRERLTDILRQRARDALKGACKSTSLLRLLGCTIEKLQEHLEKQFQPGMTWENHRYYGWHIDHVKPCAKFDLSDPEQQKVCFHYTNLQPLWRIDNLKKGAKDA